MTNDQNKNSITVKSKEKREPLEFKTLVKVDANQNNEIEKVLSVSAFCKVNKREDFDNEELINGSTTLFLCCQTAENDFFELKKEVEWQQKINSIESVNLLIEPKVVECQIMNVNTDNITINVLHNIFIDEIFDEEIGVTFQDEPGFEKDVETHDLTKIVANVNYNALISEEWETNIEEQTTIISRNVDSIIEKSYAGVDNVTIEGKLFVTLLISENNEIKTVKNVIDFKKEIECINATPGNIVTANVLVTDCSAGVRKNDNGNMTVVIDAEIGGFVVVYTEDSIEVVKDCFSAINDTNVNIESVNYNFVNNVKYENVNMDLSVTLDEKDDNKEIILVESNNVTLVDVSFVENECEVEGVIHLSVLFSNNDNRMEKYEKDVPFKTTVAQMEGLNRVQDAKFYVDNFKLKHSQEIELDGRLFLSLYNVENSQICYVSNVEFSTEERKDDVAIKVYMVGKGETLFDIAKNLGVTVSNLIAQNPDLESGVVEGEKVFAYMPLVVDFQ